MVSLGSYVLRTSVLDTWQLEWDTYILEWCNQPLILRSYEFRVQGRGNWLRYLQYTHTRDFKFREEEVTDTLEPILTTWTYSLLLTRRVGNQKVRHFTPIIILSLVKDHNKTLNYLQFVHFRESSWRPDFVHKLFTTYNNNDSIVVL